MSRYRSIIKKVKNCDNRKGYQLWVILNQGKGTGLGGLKACVNFSFLSCVFFSFGFDFINCASSFFLKHIRHLGKRFGLIVLLIDFFFINNLENFYRVIFVLLTG